MTNPNRSLLSSLASLLRATNSSLLPGVLLVCIVIFAGSRLGIPAQWFNLENLAILALLQLSVFAFTETHRIDRTLGFAQGILVHYLGFLRRYSWWALLFLALLVTSGLLVLPSRGFEVLFGPVFALFGLAIFLAVSDVSNDFVFFRRIAISPSSVAAMLLGAIFVSAYSYLSVFVPFGLPAPLLSSGLLGALFFWGMVSLCSEARATYARYRLAAGHMASRRAHTGLRLARILVSFAMLVLVGFIAKDWYAASVSPSSLVESAQPSSDDFNPVLDRFVAELDELERSGAASSGFVATASGIRENTPASSGGLAASGSTRGVSRTGSIASSWSLLATASGSVSEPEEIASEPETPAKPATPARRIRDVFPGKRYVGLGNTGKDVLWIQRLLKREGYYSGPLDSTFSEATSAALAKFIRVRARVNYDYTQLGPKAMEIFKGIEIELP